MDKEKLISRLSQFQQTGFCSMDYMSIQDLIDFLKGIQMLVEEDTKVELATDEEHNATATMFGFSATQKDNGESVLVLAPLNPVDTY